MLAELLTAALDQMGETRGPRKLLLKVKNVAEEDGVALSEAELDRLIARLTSDDENDEIRLALARWLRRWDYVEAAAWTQGTPPNTIERRRLVCQLLDLGQERISFLETTPSLGKTTAVTVIEDLADHDWWYDSDREADSFYWDNYRSYLVDRKHWPPRSIDAVTRASRAIVARLRDPCQIIENGRQTAVGFSTRGLVVGYVQSGKTANFTAVVARAVDAGYRIIVIMAGVVEILRQQTLRRLDKELFGTDALPFEEKSKYEQDEDFAEFVTYGARLTEDNAIAIRRMSEFARDYRTSPHSQLIGSTFNVPREQIESSPALVFVVKKNATVLKKLNNDIQQVAISISNVPALVIDDESDQAGVNTIDPSKRPEERTATNKEITRLLKLLPHCQYVGYTATPFANVFVNPKDIEDIFPRDYIVPLPRPQSYMGVSDFYDLDEDGVPLPDDELPTGMTSNKRAFYREVADPRIDSPEERDAEVLPRLEEAVDAFVLSGAIKCFRRARGIAFRHHTMLVHTSAIQAEHKAVARRLKQIWDSANYASGQGLDRLRSLWVNDFSRVSKERWEAGLLGADEKLGPEMVPASFEDIEAGIGECLQEIERTIDSLRATISDRLSLPDEDEIDYTGAAEILPVVVVNSDREFRDLRLDFDRQPVWAILCGGTKLSRGFTVEGLTVSYYRRKAGQADTLMQMGRWFGFRPGYGDLVRLYLGRERHGNGELDLYEEFGALCLDEETFRTRLDKYARDRSGRDYDDGPEHWRSRITPRDIPPLVSAHSRFLMPTAKNKMWNAQPSFINIAEEWQEKTTLPDAREAGKERAYANSNEEMFQNCLSGKLSKLHYTIDYVSTSKGGTSKSVRSEADAWIATVEPADVRKVLADFRFRNRDDGRPEQPYDRVLDYLDGTGSRDPKIDRWQVMIPQPTTARVQRPWVIDGKRLRIFLRNRVSKGGQPSGPFKAFSEARHRKVAEYLAGVDPLKEVSDSLAAIRGPRTAVMLLYPSLEGDAGEDCPISMGHAFICPPNDIPQRIVYQVVDPKRRDALIVERGEDE